MAVTGRVCWLGRVRFRGRPVNKIIGKNHITRVLFAASSEMQHTGCMNVFTTDHPLTSDASPLFLRLQRRVVKGFFVVLASYPLYLLLLGPL